MFRIGAEETEPLPAEHEAEPVAERQPQREIDLVSIANGVAAELRPLAEAKDLTLSFVAPACAKLHGDPDQLHRLCFNLIENAIKYTPAGSPIDLSAIQDGAAVVIEVADRGPGLPPGDEQRIFEKFYRARAPQNGSGVGLGLTICRGMVEAHGGRIWAENRSGGGAVFRFTLPIEDEDKAA